MSLDVYLTAHAPTQVFSANVTHNLGEMARDAGVYEPLWRPDDLGFTRARQLVEALRSGLKTLRADPERFRKLNPENGWGSYELLVSFVEKYLAACEAYPDAEVSVWR